MSQRSNLSSAVDLDYKFYWIDHDKISVRENLHALLKIVLNYLILRLLYY